MKRYVLLAGVNGAGKTTLYLTNPHLWEMRRVNMDEIVRNLGSWRNPSDVLKAGKEAICLINTCLDEGVSFNQETTLCGKSILRFIKRAKELGYALELYFVGLDSASVAIERVHQRVKDGGHGVPDNDIKRRYSESLSRVVEILPLCEKVDLYDNTTTFNKVAVYQQGKWTQIADTLPVWVNNLHLF